MHVDETFKREVGWFGWLSVASVIGGWVWIIHDLVTGTPQPLWYALLIIAATLLNAYLLRRDWRAVKRRRAVISSIIGGTRPGGSRLVEHDDVVDTDPGPYWHHN